MCKVNCNEEQCAHNTEITLQTTPEGLECTEVALILITEDERLSDG